MSETKSPNRRQFLGRAGGATAAAIAAGAIGLEPLLGLKSSVALGDDIGPMGPVERANLAKAIRDEQTQEERDLPIPSHPDNNDEERYARKFANYSKGLRHDAIGEVDLTADRVVEVQLSVDDVEPVRRGCVLEVRHPNLRARVQRIDGHLA